MGKFLEFVFNRIFLGMMATAYFWLLTLAGGVVFGLAPAKCHPDEFVCGAWLYLSSLPFEGSLGIV